MLIKCLLRFLEFSNLLVPIMPTMITVKINLYLLEHALASLTAIAFASPPPRANLTLLSQLWIFLIS